jgi:RNA polymerase sigma factor (sigma-70 family)
MAANGLRQALDHLYQVFASVEEKALPDEQLLQRFLVGQDQTSFAALLRRHGPMVFAVCRRILGHHQDAEDAFQATFLVFARRAGSVIKRQSLASWLHTVACRTALEVRASNARRRQKERQVADMPHPPLAAAEIDDWRPLLDQELSRLPQKYRTLLVLCDLEGLCRKEAARQLGLPEGTVSSRLTTGRRMLAKRLSRHGLTLAGGALATARSPGLAEAQLPAQLVWSTLNACRGSLSAVPTSVALLTKGVLQSMFLSKMKLVAGTIMVLSVVGAMGLAYRASGQSVPPTPGEKSARQLSSEVETLRRDMELLKRDVGAIREKVLGTSKTGQASLDAGTSGLFKFRVPFEIGVSEFTEGNRLEIKEVWGTRPKIEVGGQYLVRGKYVLVSHDQGVVYFFETADGAGGWGTILDLQQTPVRKGEGEFTLIHAMASPGWFHVVMSGGEKYGIANVYFGTGDNVLRKKW